MTAKLISKSTYYNLLLFLIISIGTSACYITPIAVPEDGTINVNGKLPINVRETDGYKLCFDFSLNLEVLSVSEFHGSEGIDTHGKFRTKTPTVCQPLYTDHEGNLDLTHHYRLSVDRRADPNYKITVNEINAYYLAPEPKNELTLTLVGFLDKIKPLNYDSSRPRIIPISDFMVKKTEISYLFIIFR